MISKIWPQMLPVVTSPHEDLRNFKEEDPKELKQKNVPLEAPSCGAIRQG